MGTLPIPKPHRNTEYHSVLSALLIFHLLLSKLTARGPPSPILQKVHVPVHSQKTCSIAYRESLHRTCICAGGLRIWCMHGESIHIYNLINEHEGIFLLEEFVIRYHHLFTWANFIPGRHWGVGRINLSLWEYTIIMMSFLLLYFRIWSI